MPHKEVTHQPEALSRLALILARTFTNRWDLFPRQLPDGSYIAIHERLNPHHLIAHLKGDITLGTYLLNAQAHGRFLVLDADDTQSWIQLRATAVTLFEQGIPSYLEASRRGGHQWFFFGSLRSAASIRQFAQGLLAAHEIEVEIYPKQSTLVTGPGSLIRLPFGIHQKSGKRYGFMTGNGKSIGTTIREQLQHFMRPLNVSEPQFREFQSRGEQLASHEAQTPNLAIREPSPLHLLPPDAPISERIKSAMSIWHFIETYLPEIQLTEQGRGFCPFHDDQARSFGVNEERNFWRCFAEGCPGYSGATIIDLWILWRGKQGREIGFKEAIKELADLLL